MYAGWRDPSRSLELATHVQPKLGGWKASNSNSKAAATITTTMIDFTTRVNQMDAPDRVPLQSAAISHTQCESSRVWWCPPWRVIGFLCD
jgi:hypothetical protein